MAVNVKVCDIDPALTERLKKFRFRKETNSAAIIIKADKDKQLITMEEEFEDVALEDLQEEIPASQPRFIVFSRCYDHGDGRKSYPLVFIYVTPQGCKPEQQMLYAGTKKSLVTETGFTKVFELRNVEDLTDEWLDEQLKFFR